MAQEKKQPRLVVKKQGAPATARMPELKEEDKTVNDEWKMLYEEAMSVLNPHDVSKRMWVGSVPTAFIPGWAIPRIASIS